MLCVGGGGGGGIVKLMVSGLSSPGLSPGKGTAVCS